MLNLAPHMAFPPLEHSSHPAAAPEGAQVMAPETVDVPLPKTTPEQIAVPASVNGRDLSQGQP